MGARFQVEKGKGVSGVRDDQALCSVCGAPVRPKRITYLQEKQGELLLVSGVPADVCVQCGEEYLRPETVDAIQTLLESPQAPETRQVPVYAFPEP